MNARAPRRKTLRLVVVGSSNTDLTLVCDRLPKPGESLLGGEFRRFHGGKGANQAVAAARAGAHVTFVGARGDDDFGRAAAANLSREGIDVRHFKIRSRISSGTAMILLGGRSRENLIAVARSANETLSGRDVLAARSAFQRADLVLAQLETPLASVVQAAALAGKHGIPFLLNPAPVRALPRRLLRLVHTLTPNEHEAALLTGEDRPERAAEAFLRQGCRQVVITLGAAGALLANECGVRKFAAPRVRPVDTVGAGDCFSAWLAVGLAEHLAVETAIERAICAASWCVQKRGAQPGLPPRSQVLSLMKRRS